MLIRLGRRLKAAMQGIRPSPADAVGTPAIIGFVGRVRDEWDEHQRQSPAALRFGMRDVLRGVGTGRRVSSETPEPMQAPSSISPDTGRPAPRVHDPLDGIDREFFARPAYALVELTNFEGAVFVEVAYRCLLKRPPDEHGLQTFGRRLLAGDIDRIDVLRGLSASAEGRARGVVVHRLARLALWRRALRVPVVGPAVAWVHTLIRLPRLARQYRVLEARGIAQWQRQQTEREEAALVVHDRLDAQVRAVEALEHRHASLQADLERIDAAASARDRQQRSDFRNLVKAGLETAAQASERALQALDAATRETSRNLADGIDRAHVRLDALAAGEAIRAERLDAVERGVDALHRTSDTLHATFADVTGGLARDATRASDRLNELQTRFGEQDHRIGDVAGRLDPIAALHAREQFDDAEYASMDAFYTGLEARFRGERDDIMRRFEPYLTFVRDAGAGTPDRPVIDLGCGRGEWLELLKLNLLHGYGVDASPAMVAHCRERGLSAECADVLTYLRATASESFGLVSAMHIVEHLSFKTLVLLIREIRRVLKPGGLLLFETPNPENLFVAAYAFRMDPTHRVPLPPPMLEYLVESQGFDAPVVLRMNAGAYGNPFADLPTADANGDGGLATRLRTVVEQHLYGPPDFAVIARKPGGALPAPA